MFLKKYAKLLHLAFFLCLFSCNSKEVIVTKPQNLLSENTFKAVLKDVLTVENYRTHRMLQGTDTLSAAQVKGYYIRIFTKNNVTDSAFFNTLKWYQTYNTDEYLIVLKALTDEFSKDLGTASNTQQPTKSPKN